MAHRPIETGMRWKNMNDVAIFLPSQTGRDRGFRPGESTNDLWFSRYIGAGQLTLCVDGGPLPPPVAASRPIKKKAPASPPVVPVIVPEAPIKSPPVDSPPVMEEVIVCGVCEKTFKTRAGLALHMTRIHPEEG